MKKQNKVPWFENTRNWNKGKNSLIDNRVSKKYKKPSDIFCENSLVSKAYVRKLIILNNLLPYKCQGNNCVITDSWLGQKITLDLDHKNGINNDHRLQNLRFLCPNCHSQTPTFRKTKNKKDYCTKGINQQQIIKKIKEGLNNNQIINFFKISIGNYNRINKIRQGLENKSKCLKCYKEINKNKTGLCKKCLNAKYKNDKKINDNFKKLLFKKCSNCEQSVKTQTKSGLCVKCSKKHLRKINRPPLDRLEKEIIEMGYSATGRKYNVSDNAIRKWIKQYKKEE